MCWILFRQMLPKSLEFSTFLPRLTRSKRWCRLQPVEPCSCTADEARERLDAIDTSTIMGLRDRALIALITFTFARVGAAAGKMRVEDVYVQGRRTWVRLHEKGASAKRCRAITSWKPICTSAWKRSMPRRIPKA
jgi:hypothetical protein